MRVASEQGAGSEGQSMTATLAERVMQLLREMDVSLGGLMEAVHQLPVGAEKTRLEGLIGNLLFQQFEAMEAIEAEHPELAEIDIE